MKHRTCTNKRYQPMYPNAAEPEYFARKALEILTAVVSGLGATAIMVFMVILA